jgi:hypothetical protein
MYALAREQRADQYFDEIIEYADQATPENVNVKRLEVDWLMNFIPPSRVSEKSQQNSCRR